MKIRLADLWDGPLDLTGSLEPEPYDLIVNGNEQWTPLCYRFHVEILGHEVLVQGDITSSLTVPCARCLELITLPIQIPHFTCSVPFTTEESIDLTLWIREDILLGLPMAPCHADIGRKCPPNVEKIYATNSDNQFAEQRRSEMWGALDKFNKEKK